VTRRGNGLAWGSLVAGVASIATLPAAIYLTRFSERYDLLDAGFAIPAAGALAVLALVLARRSRRRNVLGLARGQRPRVAQAGRILGIVGVCLALAAVVALGVYGLLEYVGSRD
jgi:peptidoglycan/LPS O-acetylase OafA/YrhL